MTGEREQPPPAVTQREVQEILRAFTRSGWRSMQLEVEGVRIAVDKDGPPPATETTGHSAPATAATAATAASEAPPAPSAPSAPSPPAAPGEPAVAPDEPAGDTTGLIEVRSPAVGAFWLAPSPGSPPFVEVGQAVDVDEQLAIVEVMKLMNAVVAPQPGEVVQVCAANSETVEFDQVLFRLRPTQDESHAG